MMSGRAVMTLCRLQQCLGIVCCLGAGLPGGQALGVTVVPGALRESTILYVATDGSDSNSGTITSPLATFNKAVNLLQPGDILYIRGGTYSQTMSVGNSGTADSPIRISGYPGETVIIDGNYINPSSSWGALVNVSGSNAIVQNLTVKRSNWMGVVLKGLYDQAISVISQSNMENGILVSGNGHNTTAQNC